MREQFVNNNSLAKSQGVGSKNRALGQWQRRVCWTSTCCSFSIIHWEPRSHSTKQHVFLFFFFFFLVIWVRLKFWFCLIFLLTHVWLLRNEEEVEETWKFESFPLFFFSGFGIIWHEHSAESGKKSNLIFLYIYCAECELYICIFNGYKLGFTFSLRLISVQFVI